MMQNDLKKNNDLKMENDPFYSKDNIAELEGRIYNLKTGKSSLIEHDLIEEDGYKNNANLYYPAIFHKAESNESGFWIEFPDIDGAFTEGKDMDEAMNMAKDCLDLVLSYYIDEGKQLPKPSSLEDIKAKHPNEIVELVEYKIEIDPKQAFHKLIGIVPKDVDTDLDSIRDERLKRQ